MLRIRHATHLLRSLYLPCLLGISLISAPAQTSPAHQITANHASLAASIEQSTTLAYPTRGPELNQPPILGPTIIADGIKPGAPLKIIAYGDTRFTDPANVKDTNPRMRKFLVDRIAAEAPDALFETGDLPMTGSYPPDWTVFRAETAVWRKQNLRVYPAIGNHEAFSDIDKGIRNYLAAFPYLNNCRYYSVLLGNVYLISIDEFSSMADGARQRSWLTAQLEHLPPQVDFVFFLDHMPLIADLQSQVAVGLPEQHETDIRLLLEHEKPKTHAKFVVLNGHIHNYERFERAGITYIITGGGGAKPYPIYVRGPEDLYRDTRFPVFHYVIFLVNGSHADATMYRVDAPSSATPKMEPGERFTLDAPPR